MDIRCSPLFPGKILHPAPGDEFAYGPAHASGWRAAGVLDAKISGGFVTAFCCSEEVELRKDSLQYDEPTRKNMETFVHVGLRGDNDDYPDLIEPDAKINSFICRQALGLGPAI